MMHKRVTLMTLVCLLVGSMALTARGGQARQGTPVAPTGDPIVIGAAVHLTDWMAAYDVPPLESAKLAVKVINEQGGVLGRPLQIIELDGKTDPATVGNAAIQLIEEGAEVMLAPCDFDYGAPVGQAAQEAGIVGISFCASSPLYGSETLGDLQFTLSMWNQTMSAAAAEFACKTNGWTTAATIVDTTTEYTQSLGDFFVETFEHHGCTIVSEDTYTGGDLQIDAQIQRLQGLDEQPAVIFITTNSPDTSMMVRELRAAGFTQPLIGGDSFDTADFYPAIGAEAGNDVYVVTHSFLGSETGPAMDEFMALFQEEYGKAPETALGVTGWDAVHVIAQAIEKAGTTDGPALAVAMEELTFDLLSGQLDWSTAAEGHAPNKEAFILVVTQGVPTFVQRLKPEWTPEE